jgi:hypothetical protein
MNGKKYFFIKHHFCFHSDEMIYILFIKNNEDQIKECYATSRGIY